MHIKKQVRNHISENQMPEDAEGSLGMNNIPQQKTSEHILYLCN